MLPWGVGFFFFGLGPLSPSSQVSGFFQPPPPKQQTDAPTSCGCPTFATFFPIFPPYLPRTSDGSSRQRSTPVRPIRPLKILLFRPGVGFNQNKYLFSIPVFRDGPLAPFSPPSRRPRRRFSPFLLSNKRASYLPGTTLFPPSNLMVDKFGSFDAFPWIPRRVWTETDSLSSLEFFLSGRLFP